MTNAKVKTEDEKKTVEGKDMIEKEQYLRLAADFENFRKEANRREERAIEFGKKMIIEDILELLDNFGIAFSHDMPQADSEWAEGVQKVIKQFLRAIEKWGVKQIKTTDKKFDPVTMEAVGTAPDGESNIVQSQQRAGWTMNGRVIRPARVIVYSDKP
jgi:molecular chaperone GrpE